MQTFKAIQLIRDDHKTLRGLFRQIEVANTRAPEMHDGVAKEIFMLLEVHFAIEEEYFYPLLQDVILPDPGANSDIRDLADRGIEDHAAARNQIQALRSILGDTSRFRSQMGDLIDMVEAHMEEEEQDVLPFAESALGPVLDDMGRKMEARKRELIDLPEYLDARPEVVQYPHGGEQSRRHLF
jgi:hemerythrin-like domain-containing protein